MGTSRLLSRIRRLLAIFLAGLVISGLTAIPLKWEIDLLLRIVAQVQWVPVHVAEWVRYIHKGISGAFQAYPFLAYGTDWLAFAHVVIAIAIIGPIRDPIRNVWVIEFGMVACVLVIPTALLFGPLRGIPGWWTLIDMSFGLVGFMPLWLARHWVRRLDAISHIPSPAEASTT